MSQQDVYDRTLDPPANSAPSLPDEPYYRQPQTRASGGRRGLGMALLIVGLVLLLVQFSGRGLAIGGGDTHSLADKTLPGNRIELNVASSDVDVNVWNETGIRVRATQHGGRVGDYTVDVSQNGETVKVGESGGGSFWCLFCSRSVQYEIDLPVGVQADLHTASGDITIDGIEGAVTLGTISGDVRAKHLGGGLTVNSTSGEVKLEKIAGPLNVSTISGDVSLEDGSVSNATVETTSGDVKLDGVSDAIQLSSVSGDMRISNARNATLQIGTTSGEVRFDGSLARSGTNDISSISGDVNLSLPEDAAFQLDASTVSGDISNDFNLAGGSSGLRSLAGTAGAGGGTLKIDTTSGEIQIEHN